MISLVLLSSGSGSRMENSVPKQYLSLGGKPIIIHTLERLAKVKEISEVVICCTEEYMEHIAKLIENHCPQLNYKLVKGGKTRQESTWNGIQVCENKSVMIHEAVFALGQSPTEGPGLIFVVLPAIFEQIPFGNLFMIIFFILMLFATLTSSISMLEIVVSTGIRTRTDRRKRAAWVFGVLIFIIGIPSALSFGLLSGVNVFGGTIFDFADLLTSRIGMPIGALLISLFAGFVLTKKQTIEELNTHPIVHALWKFLVRFAAPIAIAIIFAAWIFEITL